MLEIKAPKPKSHCIKLNSSFSAQNLDVILVQLSTILHVPFLVSAVFFASSGKLEQTILKVESGKHTVPSEKG